MRIESEEMESPENPISARPLVENTN